MKNNHSGKEKIEIVETIRGLAALLVCLFHFGKANIPFVGSAAWYPKITTFGWVGVEAFFVLSGFIIPYAMVRSGYTRGSFWKFFAKRCLRIEPPYLVSIVMVLGLNFLVAQMPGFKGQPFQLNWGQVFAHLAYLPEHLGFTWLVDVYWSLEAEFHFYILIGLLLPLLWRSQVSLALGMLLALASSFFIKLYVFSYAPLFVMGIATCAYRFGKINVHIFWTLLLLAFETSLLRGQDIRMPLTGLVTALAIIYLNYASAVTAFLGRISYSLYLIHIPVGSKILNLGGRYADTGWKVWLILLVAMAFTIFASWVFYKLVEFPAQQLSKKLRYQAS